LAKIGQYGGVFASFGGTTIKSGNQTSRKRD
jgi:hypothetical protein